MRAITNSVGLQVQGVNSTTEKMKEKCDDRSKHIDGRIDNMEEKISMRDETSEIKADESSKVHEDQNHTIAEGDDNSDWYVD